MVLFVITEGMPGKDESADACQVKAGLLVPNTRAKGDVYDISVVKFKIGTLDMLMELNETLV